MEDIGCRGRKYVVTKMIFFEVYYFILHLKKKENHKFSNARGCRPYGAELLLPYGTFYFEYFIKRAQYK